MQRIFPETPILRSLVPAALLATLLRGLRRRNGGDPLRPAVRRAHPARRNGVGLLGRRASREISATDVLWEFFRAHPKRD